MNRDIDKESRFEQLLEENRRRLASIARSYASGDEWHDLFQEMLLQIWKSLDSFQQRSAAQTWVYRVALNTAITYRRHTAVRLSQVEADDGSVAPRSARAGAAGPRSEVDLLREFIGSLGEVDRAVFMLYLEDVSYREMGDILGMSESNVGVRISRIKKAFQARYFSG